MNDTTLGARAAVFAKAEFARHPDGSIAARLYGDDELPWLDGETPCSDAEMAQWGWSPVWECQDRDVHWRYVDLLDELNEVRHQRDEARARADQAEARAEKAEQEVEHLRTVLDTTARQRDEADKRVAKVVKERDQAIADQHMTADQHLAAAVAHGVTVTDEMVERARKVWETAHGCEDIGVTLRRALTAALTPEPQRPDGAEEIAAAITEWDDSGALARSLSDAATDDLADFLASRGVRVEGSGR